MIGKCLNTLKNFKFISLKFVYFRASFIGKLAHLTKCGFMHLPNAETGPAKFQQHDGNGSPEPIDRAAAQLNAESGPATIQSNGGAVVQSNAESGPATIQPNDGNGQPEQIGLAAVQSNVGAVSKKNKKVYGASQRELRPRKNN